MTVADWPEKYRPPAEARWTNGRTEPVTIEVRTRFLYGDDDYGRPDRPVIREDGKAAHAFARSAYPTEYGYPAPYLKDIRSLLHEAIELFGDDADLVIEVRRK